MSDNNNFHLGMANARGPVSGVKSITKTFYVDMTDLLVYLDRIMPTMLNEAKKDPHPTFSFDTSIKAVDIVDLFLSIKLLAANDPDAKMSFLHFLLGQHFNAVSNLVHSKVASVFGGMDAIQFERIAQYISYSFAGYGIIFTIPTAEWVE